MASTEGRILSLGRYVNRGNGNVVYNPPKLKEQVKNKKDYLVVSISIDSKVKTMRVARLILLTFKSNPENKPFVDHIDRDKSNNRLSNLRWCTALENQHNAKTEEYRKNNRQCYHMNNVPIVALECGVVVKKYQSISEAEKEGHARRYVSKVCRKKRDAYHGYQWMYLEDYEKSISSSSRPE